MNICFEWIFWIFIKWKFFWTNILVVVYPRQKWLLPNVSKSSEIIQRSLVGPISVHSRGSITYTGVSGGLRSHIWPYFGILNNFTQFFWMNNSIEYPGLYWMNILFKNIFWMNILHFVLNWIIFWPNSMKR